MRCYSSYKLRYNNCPLPDWLASCSQFSSCLLIKLYCFLFSYLIYFDVFETVRRHIVLPSGAFELILNMLIPFAFVSILTEKQHN